ncbi:MAG: hypothetical protein A3K19_03045 [Lentisphaerae bacterium RIFOXYB12_FULL_65_16]|nr:MAG: hypothetical protein A3K18_23550 [Lentisphaerae bacterium RIFOXYA12_64_32]OGV92104.1 MAG: hypothetical protein A3K19_03045 [Lentisphaerae bacterium RIFOXYB12_FULL_65_16]
MKNMLIIGAGGIAHRHIRGFLKTGRARLAIVEPDAQKRDAVRKDYGIERAYADISEADLPGFDGAVICAPAHVHVPLARKCAEAGLPFLLEKPLAVTLDGVDELLDAVRSKGLLARVAYVRRVAEDTIAFATQVREGRIGTPKMCYINVSQDFPKYRPDFQRTYYAKKAMGGGALLDAGSHMIDLLLWMLGPVSEVFSMYDRLVLEGTEVEDSALTSMRFASGAMAQLSQNQFQKPNVATLEMIGTKGNLRFDLGAGVIRFAGDDSGHWDEQEFSGGGTPMERHELRFGRQADLFLDMLDGKPSLLATLDDARDNLRVVLAAKESYATGRMVKL